MAELNIRGISKSYGKVKAVDGVSLDVRKGEYVTLLGPSGAGKTTLMRVVAGLTDQDSGEVWIGGKRVDRLPSEQRRIAFLPQSYSLFPHMDVWGNVTFGPTARKWKPERVAIIGREMLEMVRLYRRRDAFPRELSGGMSQRCALARALAAEAQVLLLDEPLRALDARLRIQLRQEIRALAKGLGLTVLHVTHDQEEAMAISDRIVILRRGKLVQAGTPREIYERPASPFVMQFVGEANFLEGHVEPDGDGWEFDSDCGVEIDGMRGEYSSMKRAVAGVKAERLVLSPRKVSKSIEGMVARRLFLGRFVMLEVETQACGLLRCKTTIAKAEKMAEGAPVWAHIPPEHLRIFAPPEGGLQAELEVD